GCKLRQVADVSLRLLGGFGARVGGAVVEERVWRLRKARMLVKLLALEPTRRLHRELVMELLWPDLDAVAAQNNFHQALHAARRVLGAERVQLADGMVELVAVETDVDAFTLAAIDARESVLPDAYAVALDLYGGELLPEDRYESWAEVRRAALADLHSALCLELAELQPTKDAVPTLQRALDADPLHEPAHRALMRAYKELGRRQDALAQFHRLRAALRQRLEADPDAETRALYRELLTVQHEAATGLPMQITSFVGRARELAAVAERLGTARVLTLTGPGGSGKTRLAVAVAEQATDLAADGVFFVELAGIADTELVAEAAATAVGIRVPSKRMAAEAVAEHLANRRALLVLDTCEHVVEACAVLVDAVLRACPSVTVLATSREPLRCSSEMIWRVPGLDLAESLELFVSRARDLDPSFTASDTANIEALCARLDGMPLAIELAAARAPTLAPSQIAARLDDSLDVLSSGRRTALPRQQTLTATIAWSHNLLTGEEGLLFRRLAVFAGSFSLDAVADVCTAARSTAATASTCSSGSSTSRWSRSRTRLPHVTGCSTPSASSPPSAWPRRASARRSKRAFASGRRGLRPPTTRSIGSSWSTTISAPRSIRGCGTTLRGPCSLPQASGVSGSTGTTSRKACAGCAPCSKPRPNRRSYGR
ncbi:MAG: hypothetical protein M3O89_11810, partial [Actinomycetota bacterium]|nr:hypothetical protein [Actinomycetota bacterium]